MDELIQTVEKRRQLDEASLRRTARRLRVSAETVHRRYQEAIRPLVAHGAALSLEDQEAIAASPDRRAAVTVLRLRGRDESAVVLLDAIAHCPGRLLLDLRRRDPLGLWPSELESSDEVTARCASREESEA